MQPLDLILLVNQSVILILQVLLHLQNLALPLLVLLQLQLNIHTVASQYDFSRPITSHYITLHHIMIVTRSMMTLAQLG